MSTIQKDKISIALCTRNGESYLEEQLQSLEKQSLRPDELVISDDASSDSTLYKIKHFSAKSNLNIRLIQNKEKLGVIKNFSQAIASCQGNYLALCDQDDIWLPCKLEYSYELIKKEEDKIGKDTPLLLHSDLEVIDQAGYLIAPSFMKMRKITHLESKALQRLLVQNFVTGSTVMFNSPLLQLALPIPSTAIMHDWWLALVASASGKIIYTNKATVQYRQHSKNYFGPHPLLSIKSLKRIIDISTLEEEFAATIIQAQELKKRLHHQTRLEKTALLDKYLAAVEKGGLKAVKLVHREKFNKSGAIRNLYFLLILLKKSYLKNLD